jgi:hypothetical protein
LIRSTALNDKAAGTLPAAFARPALAVFIPA